MIAAFARMARVAVGEVGAVGAVGVNGHDAAPYLHAAQRAASCVHDRLWRAESQTLLRRFRDGQAEIDGYADDYAYLIFGLLELFQADGDPAWIEWAVQLQDRQDALFWDEVDGGWFSTTGQDRTVLLRMKEDYDGAEPSASSISVMNLLVLSHLIDNPRWTEQIERTLRAFGSRLEQVGRAVPMMGAALSTSLAGVQQCVFVGAETERRQLARVMAGRYLPFAVTIDVRAEHRDRLASIMPIVGGMLPPADGAAAYVCRHFACQAPVTSVRELEGILA